MFKFMKSKKGFTLVELMIVVVIMAILVAVAVPIYSAVTANAKKKTCIANQRELVSTIANWYLSNNKTISGTGNTIVIKNDNGKGEWSAFNGSADLNKDSIRAAFQTIPYCPVDDGVITVTLTLVGDTVKVETACAYKEDNKAAHVLA